MYIKLLAERKITRLIDDVFNKIEFSIIRKIKNVSRLVRLAEQAQKKGNTELLAAIIKRLREKELMLSFREKDLKELSLSRVLEIRKVVCHWEAAEIGRYQESAFNKKPRFFKH